MSISPSGRDLVLAARAGMYIVDLENTRDTPRFLPQGATWEVADVQWNPHHSNSELIVSTSNQKLVIWNLRLTGMTSIQHILHGHFRAITDINWHPLRENIVASISIDGWTMIWDVRDRMKKDVMRMTTWEDAGTQVKWNYKHPHILASAHKGHVQLWDDRKGAVPLKTIYAHHSKIYGIDWSRVAPDELITCSLDSSIKRFDTSRPEDDSDSQTLTPPSGVIQTANPVWRARHLPFGRGVLSLPHRGSYTLEMYEFGNEEESVVDFERTALVKEYVWRSRGGTDPSFGTYGASQYYHIILKPWILVDDREFQLVTLATDRTVKLEYIPPTVLEVRNYNRPQYPLLS
ncbi:WD40 repeat-like protein [Clavulina sp. PMI_390]|nr:WD40 repeat-like protein [Clavulina sp. PMI_390]